MIKWCKMILHNANIGFGYNMKSTLRTLFFTRNCYFVVKWAIPPGGKGRCVTNRSSITLLHFFLMNLIFRGWSSSGISFPEASLQDCFSSPHFYLTNNKRNLDCICICILVFVFFLFLPTSI